jgi:acyl transferase domain-containing protein
VKTRFQNLPFKCNLERYIAGPRPRPGPHLGGGPGGGGGGGGGGDDLTGGGVAIVGISGRFPGAANVDAFWEMLTEGRCAARRFTDDELNGTDLGERVWGHPQWVPAGYAIDDADQFDAALFGVGAKEATLMDPQQRLFLQEAWGACESAGHAPRGGPDPDDLDPDTGVFAGCGIDGYLVHHLKGGGLTDPLNPGRLFLTETGNEKDYIATRVAYALDINGPAMTINTACSSGLVALSQAAASMRAGKCAAAIAGAASVTFPNLGYRYAPDLMFSPDGVVRPFDEAAAGTVFGDTVGALLLRGLGMARASRDHVWAVVRGTGVTNDGRRRKAGFAAPSAVAQASAVRRAMREARVTPRDVSYVECHATATSIGDGIEAHGLLDAFRTEGGAGRAVEEGWCALGSVKGNIGHANCAAGLSAVIKLALCLKHRTLVPTANFRSLSPKLPLQGSPFFVSQGTVPWTQRARGAQYGVSGGVNGGGGGVGEGFGGGFGRSEVSGGGAAVRVGALPGQPLVGGVSSFGIGGTNAHAVLSTAGAYHLLTLVHVFTPHLSCVKAS